MPKAEHDGAVSYHFGDLRRKRTVYMLQGKIMYHQKSLILVPSLRFVTWPTAHGPGLGFSLNVT